MTEALEEFLAGERPDDVALFLSETAVDDPASLAAYGERVEGGIVLVLEGETGRNVFRRATGTEATAFAGRAMDTEGAVDADLTGGTCPEDDGDGEHGVRIVLAFVEAENPDVGGRYAEGDVVHAYAACTCGTAYSDRWVAGERSD